MKFFVVPDSSERWQTVIVVPGRLAPLLSLAIAGSFHVLILPEEDVRDRRAVELQALVDAVDLVGDRHRAERPSGRGRASPLPAAALISSSFIAESERAEVDGAGGELRDAAPRADGLVVDRGALGVLEARRPLAVDGRGNVAPAPLMVPPFWAPELLALLEEPLGLLSSLPQAAMPAASSAVQPTARTFVERKGCSL